LLLGILLLGTDFLAIFNFSLVAGFAYNNPSARGFSGYNGDSFSSIPAAGDSSSSSFRSNSRNSLFAPSGYALPASSPQLPDPEYAPKYPAFPSFDTLGNDFYSNSAAEGQQQQFKRYILCVGYYHNHIV
jgi:hypothetical protein